MTTVLVTPERDVAEQQFGQGELEPSPSQRVYLEVMRYADTISVINEEAAVFLDEFYNDMEIKHTGLKQYGTLENIPAEEGQETVQHDLLVKPELDQVTGSFKARGNAMKVMGFRHRQEKVTQIDAGSTGNHVLGTAHAARKIGAKAVAHTPRDLTPAKRRKLKAAGVKIVADYDDVDLAIDGAELAAEEIEGARFIHAFNDPEVIAGQASVGNEILDDLFTRQDQGDINLLEDEVVVTVPVGGGGFITGIACAFYKARKDGKIGRNVKIVGVRNPNCDGTKVKRLGSYAQAVIDDPEFVAGVIDVSNAVVGAASLKLRTIHGTDVESAATLSMAGAMTIAKDATQKITFVTITSGREVSEPEIRPFRLANMMSERSTSVPEMVRRLVKDKVLEGPHDNSPDRESKRYLEDVRRRSHRLF